MAKEKLIELKKAFESEKVGNSYVAVKDREGTFWLYEIPKDGAIPITQKKAPTIYIERSLG